MGDSTQHSVPATLATIRARLFGSYGGTKPLAADVSKAAGRTDQRNAPWQRRWDAAPDVWKHYVANLEKRFGMSEAEEQRILDRKESYVATPDLRRRGRVGTSMLILTVGSLSKVLLAGLNTQHAHNLNVLYEAIEARPRGHGLMTVSNHQSVMDDPFLLGSLLPARILLNASAMRWGLCSLDICFQDWWVGRFLRLGKAMPIERRGGISQTFLRDAADKLSDGDWVHIFPEGRVRQQGMGYFKRGVGKLLAMTYEKTGTLPTILPLYHEGMERVMPQRHGSNELEGRLPKRGRTLVAMVGDPVDVAHIFDRLMPACEAAGGTARDDTPCLRLYEEVADFLGIVMRLLRAETRSTVKAEHDVDLGQPFELS